MPLLDGATGPAGRALVRAAAGELARLRRIGGPGHEPPGGSSARVSRWRSGSSPRASPARRGAHADLRRPARSLRPHRRRWARPGGLRRSRRRRRSGRPRGRDGGQSSLLPEHREQRLPFVRPARREPVRPRGRGGLLGARLRRRRVGRRPRRLRRHGARSGQREARRGARGPARGRKLRSEACWKPLGKPSPNGKGFAYKDPDGEADGVRSLKLAGGTEGRSSIALAASNRAKKEERGMPAGIALALAAGDRAGARIRLVLRGRARRRHEAGGGPSKAR
jgi:hypothetical protein